MRMARHLIDSQRVIVLTCRIMHRFRPCRVARTVRESDQRPPDDAPLLALQPDLHTAVATDAAARTAFDLDTAGHRVYVVDPTGRIILRYPADAEPRDILKDMERLLRYAWAG